VIEPRGRTIVGGGQAGAGPSGGNVTDTTLKNNPIVLVPRAESARIVAIYRPGVAAEEAECRQLDLHI